jgi:hypothetical protein
MRKKVLPFIFLLLGYGAHSQNLCSGVYGFTLDTPQSSFTGLMAIKGGTYKKDSVTYTIYEYHPADVKEFVLGEVRLNNLTLIFNSNGQLFNFDFMRLYVPGRKHFEGNAQKDYKRLIEYLTKEQGQEGKKKIYYKRKKFIHEGYEWDCGNATLKLTIQSNSGKAPSDFIDIIVERK